MNRGLSSAQTHNVEGDPAEIGHPRRLRLDGTKLGGATHVFDVERSSRLRVAEGLVVRGIADWIGQLLDDVAAGHDVTRPPAHPPRTRPLVRRTPSPPRPSQP